MRLQKKIDLRESYRSYQSTIRHTGMGIEIVLMPGAVEKHYGRKEKNKR